MIGLGPNPFYENKLNPYNKNENPVMGNAIPVLGVKLKRGWYLFCIFLEIGLRSAISFKRSRRELSIDMAEHRSWFKNYRNTLYHVLVSYPKQVWHSSKRGFRFNCTVNVKWSNKE